MEDKRNDLTRIGREIAAKRTEKGLTQKQLSELCGVSNVNISKIERGAYNPSVELLGRIASHLGLEIALIKQSLK